MAERSDVGMSRLWRVLRLGGLGIAIVFLIGMAAGFMTAHLEDGGGFGLVPVAVLGAIASAAIGCLWLVRRELQAETGEDPLTPIERSNRNLLIASGALGLIIAMVMVFAVEDPGETGAIFSNEPLPTGVAMALVLVIGLLLPAISIYWHRIIDEQEAAAVGNGALFGLYAYWIGAPVWWLAWRGGFAPAPDGIAIYMITIVVVGAVWLWRKYR